MIKVSCVWFFSFAALLLLFLLPLTIVFHSNMLQNGNYFFEENFFCSFNFFFWTSLSSNGNDSIFFFSCVHTAVNRFRSESTTRSYVLADDRGCNARLLLKSIALCVCLSLSPSLHCVSGDECEMIFYADDRRVSEIFFIIFDFF